MLERLHIQNYKCLLNVMVELGDFTVLIGPNDSGKSSFLEVVRDLGRLTSEPPQQVFSGDRSQSNLVWRKDPGRSIVWDAQGRASGDPFVYHVELPASGGPINESLELKGKRVFWTEGQQVRFAEGGGGPVVQGVGAFAYFKDRPPYSIIAADLASTSEYHFDPAKLCEPSVPQPDVVLSAAGDNLASVLDGLLSSPDRSRFRALEDALHRALPGLSGIALPPLGNRAGVLPGAKAVEFILAGNGQPPVTIPASLASSGALLLTAFLALAYADTPSVVLLEEPENGLHPSRLEQVIDILRKMSRA